MRYILVVHQNNKLPDLREEFTDEAALNAELQKLKGALSANNPPSLLTTTSNKIMFKYGDFAGVEHTGRISRHQHCALVATRCRHDSEFKPAVRNAGVARYFLPSCRPG